MSALMKNAPSILFDDERHSPSYKLGERQIAHHKAKCAARRRREGLRRKHGVFEVTQTMSDAWSSAPDFCAIRERVDYLLVKNGGRA